MNIPEIRNIVFPKTLQLVFSVSFIIGCAQKKETSVNGFLDNHTFNSCYEDTVNFEPGNIFSVTKFKKAAQKNRNSVNRDGLYYTRESYTEYLPDGRKLYHQYYNGNTDPVIEKFHYRNGLPVMRESVEKNIYSYNWLFYDKEHILQEEIDYKIDDRKAFIYEGYTKYSHSSDGKKTTVKIIDYSYDSLANPEEEYIFEFPFLTKKTPLYQTKVHRYQWIKGTYKPIDSRDYIIENRDVTFSYDKNGYLLSEIWLANHNSLENKTEYYYSEDYRERTEQQYHMLGTEKSTKTLRKYDDHNNLIFEQSIEYTGHPLYAETFEYVYDQQGNWISKKHYRQDPDEGAGSKKKLIDYEYREIKYYTPDSKPKSFTLPDFPKEAENIRTGIPKVSGEKQSTIDAFQDAVKSGNFDTEISLKKAKSPEEFTPEFWTLKDKQFGNLDNTPEDEAVCVYETPMEGDLGFAQSLAVYKKEGENWVLWHQSTNPILSTQHGGMMGNPYEGISIKNKTIIINHFGGSRQKWHYTHRYRFQNNNWYLIGASVNIGAPCDYFQSLDYNLSTGDAVFDYSSEDCNKNNTVKTKSWKEKINKKIPSPLMDEFQVGENKIELKSKKTEMFY
ncbi:hypothetical protein P2W68_06320 [Chryseobacterium arthrosphaerae]|uniref:hypothetical protein n=1 Tax=Chryseobacterium arthrosphaerae TaxID=651561 RepID=UPI0023E12F1E|nr:hypothetical protein [Chryseobacterium arthrosphaerae]WES99227.1 hypothetical protein P2W68_06320 [Chryseobacterium arthrosphaerae]